MDLFNPNPRKEVKIFGQAFSWPLKNEKIIISRHDKDKVINLRIVTETGQYIDTPILLANIGKTANEFVNEFKKIKNAVTSNIS